jgi:L-ascorbate metabolism protein UlaG (beta-lactamase superfamily)
MKIEGVHVSFLGHSGVILSNGHRIAIDPYHISPSVEPVDFILITHSHFDHCSIKDIQKLVKSETIVIGPADIQSSIMKIEGVHVQPVEVGDHLSFDNIEIEAVPAYNLTKFRDISKKLVFHDKKEGFLGYVIKWGNVVLYHAGDTDLIPEMQRLTGYGKHGTQFVAFLPVSGTYVMTPEEASKAADMLKPSVVIPIHYGAGVAGTLEDARLFTELCKEKGIHAELLDKL